MIRFSKLCTKDVLLLPLSVALSLSLANADELSQSSASTESADSQVENMDKVKLQRSVVTASGYAQDIKDAPASITIIDKEEIMTRPIRDLGDAVQDVPGVYVEQDKTGQNTISMRGLGSAYTLILIDGKRQNTAQGFVQNGLGNQTSFMPPVSMIERIEVIRGPASIIYGSDAMGGVINIITKRHFNKFSSGVQIESKFFEPGEWGNAYGANAYINTPLIKDRLSLNLRGAYRYNEANAFLNPSYVTNAAGNPYAAHSATGSQNWNAGFRLNWTPTSNNYIYLDSEVYNGRLGSLNTSSNSITSIQELYKSNNILSHEGKYDWGQLSSYVQYAYNVIAPHASYSSTSLPIGATKGDYINWANKRTNHNVSAQSTYTNDFDFGEAGSLIFNGGLYYLYENLVGNFGNGFGKRDLYQNQAAIFAEGEYLINDYFSATLGLRYNYSDRYNIATTLNPRFYINFNPTDWLTFKAGVASGMLTPPLLRTIDGYAETTSNSSNATRTYGNPNLKPEQSLNYELSAILDLEQAMLILTGYYTDFNNQIETLTNLNGGYYMSEIGISCPNSTTCSYYRNIDKSLVSGVEASFKLKPVSGFGLDVNYGFTHTEALSGATKGEPINSIARHSFTIKPEYTHRNFNMYVRWSGKYKTPTPANGSNARTGVRDIVGQYYKDYQLVDIAATYKFNKNLALTFAINNLFDVYFMDYIRYSNNGRASAQNAYQRILPSRNYWISFKADF